MMPMGDDNSEIRTIPVVTYALIVLNVLFFLLELSQGESFIMNWSFIPSHFLSNPIANIPTIFTSMFMHAGFAHLFGNMLYLWIFGDNLEDHFGKIKYLIFYLICGIAATFAQLVLNPTSDLPNLGASGAIAGVLGGYLYLRPKGKINVLVGRSVSQMPALIVIGLWFLIQFVSEIGTLASTSKADTGGVAYMAHIGGFLAGLFLTFMIDKTGLSHNS